jgi:transposase
MPQKDSAEKAVRDIRRKTRRKFSAEEKIRIVLEGLRGEESIASLCRREGIAANLYYRWSKENSSRNVMVAVGLSGESN